MSGSETVAKVAAFPRPAVPVEPMPVAGSDFGLKRRLIAGLIVAGFLVFVVGSWAAVATLSGAVVASAADRGRQQQQEGPAPLRWRGGRDPRPEWRCRRRQRCAAASRRDADASGTRHRRLATGRAHRSQGAAHGGAGRCAGDRVSGGFREHLARCQPGCGRRAPPVRGQAQDHRGAKGTTPRAHRAAAPRSHGTFLAARRQGSRARTGPGGAGPPDRHVSAQSASRHARAGHAEGGGPHRRRTRGARCPDRSCQRPDQRDRAANSIDRPDPAKRRAKRAA